MESKKNIPPKFYLGLKITGFLMLVIGITLVVLGIIIRQPFGSFTEQPTFALLVPGIFIVTFSIPAIAISFSPEIEKIKIEKNRYIQEETKEDLTAMADNTADITGGAIKRTARAVREGLKNTKYCKHCGVEIDADSVFCNKCGNKQ